MRFRIRIFVGDRAVEAPVRNGARCSKTARTKLVPSRRFIAVACARITGIGVVRHRGALITVLRVAILHEVAFAIGVAFRRRARDAVEAGCNVADTLRHLHRAIDEALDALEIRLVTHVLNLGRICFLLRLHRLIALSARGLVLRLGHLHS
ncbi:MAG TPA: hypothetical protein VH054_28125 [Polyangiaceae bacterium]|nr:hypothetical protein [Polyangiaceae bacterium]